MPLPIDAEDVRDTLMRNLSFDANFEREGDILRMDYAETSVWVYPTGEIAEIETLPKKAQKEVKTLIAKLMK